MLKTLRNQFGETIVEVLICIAILSIGLGTSFLISGQASKTSISNESEFQAQLYANEQINYLQQYLKLSSASASVRNVSGYSFCLNYDYGSSSYTIASQCSKKSPTLGVNFGIVVVNKGSASGRLFNTYDIRVTWQNTFNSNTNLVEVAYGA
jgi:type II secretory pathway pseudopilin PulG